jgi:hypothetical protein
MTGLSFLKGTRALVKSFIARVNTDGGIIEAAKCIGDLDADLVMQPSGYKATKLYSQKPASGVGDFTVDRNSTATRVNSLGLIESVAANVPRLDYTDGNCPSLLLEPQSTNLITYSEDFSDSSWAKTNSPSTQLNAETSPNGNFNANLLTSSSTLSAYFESITVIPNKFYSISCFFKKQTSNIVRFDLRFPSGTSQNFAYNYEIDTDTLTPIGNVAIIAKVINYNNGWLRILIVGQNESNSASATGTFQVYPDRSLGTGGVLIWGAQLEESSVATSYIPTSGTTVTRLADLVDGAGDVNTFNDSEGVLYGEIAALSDDLTNREISLSDGTTNNRLEIRYSSTSNRMQVISRVNSTIVSNLSFILNNSTDFNKIAFKYKENDFALWINGVEVDTDLSGSTYPTSTLNKISFNNGAGGESFFGKCKDLQYYNTALTDERLIYITGTLNENYYNTYFDMSNALNYTSQ